MFRVVGLLLTPVAALAGTLIVIVGLQIVLGPQLRLSEAAELVPMGIAVGSALAAPVTIGVLPWAMTRAGATVRLVIAHGLGSGFAASALLSLPLFGAMAFKMLPLWLLLVLAGTLSGGLAAALMLLAAPLIGRRESRS